jgi:hypothetical protein
MYQKNTTPQIYFSKLLTVTTPFNVCMEICAADLNIKMTKTFNKGNLSPKSLKIDVKRVRILKCGTLNDGAPL